MPDAPSLTSGPDDGDGARRQQTRHRGRLGALLAVSHERTGLGRRFEAEVDLDHALLERTRDLEADLVEDPEHLAVGGQDLRREPGEAVLAGRDQEVLEQDGGETSSLVVVVDDEGHLGLVAVVPRVVAGHAHDLVGQHRHQAQAGHVVDDDQPLELAGPSRGIGLK